MKDTCYILFSKALDRYYIGYTTTSVGERLIKHNESLYGSKYTSVVDDWAIYLEITCNCSSQALKIERHLKRMKSKVYIENLKKYPEIIERLKIKYECK